MTPSDRRRRRDAPPAGAPPDGHVPDNYGDEIDWFAQLRSAPSGSRGRQGRREPGGGRRQRPPEPPQQRRQPAPPRIPRRPPASLSQQADGSPGRPAADPPRGGAVDPRNLDAERVELLPPGRVDPGDQRRRSRRGAVIDGEVTGELPRVVDGEVTGEIPAVAGARRPAAPPRRPEPPRTPGSRTGDAGAQDYPTRSGRPDRSRGKGRQRRAAGDGPPASGEGPGENSGKKRRDAGRPRRAKAGTGVPRKSSTPGTRSAPTAVAPGRRQLKQQLREVERLRLITLAFVTLVLLGSIPGFLLIKNVTRDPAFRAMNALELPTWAARRPVDSAVGNRWCIRTCRIRQRMWESGKAQKPTVTAYRTALQDEGWKRWDVTGCPARTVRGDYSCWRHDEYTLDLWVRAPDCRRRGGGGSAATGAGDNRCPESVVTVVIRNAGADTRLR